MPVRLLTANLPTPTVPPAVSGLAAPSEAGASDWLDKLLSAITGVETADDAALRPTPEAGSPPPAPQSGPVSTPIPSRVTTPRSNRAEPRETHTGPRGGHSPQRSAAAPSDCQPAAPTPIPSGPAALPRITAPHANLAANTNAPSTNHPDEPAVRSPPEPQAAAPAVAGPSPAPQEPPGLSRPLTVPSQNPEPSPTSVTQAPALPVLQPPATIMAAAHAPATTPTANRSAANAPMPATQLTPVIVSLVHNSVGPQHLTLRLDPPELGNVQIRLERPPDAPARIEITVQRPETLALLQRDQPHLQQVLDQAGIPAEGRTVSFHLGPQDQGSQRDGQSQNRTSPVTAPGPQNSDTDDLPPQTLPVQRWWRAGLDITA